MSISEDSSDDALSRSLRKDRRYRRLTKRVLAAQDAIRAAVTRKTWHLYLLLEEIQNERHAYVVDVAVRLGVRRDRRVR